MTHFQAQLTRSFCMTYTSYINKIYVISYPAAGYTLTYTCYGQTIVDKFQCNGAKRSLFSKTNTRKSCSKCLFLRIFFRNHRNLSFSANSSIYSMEGTMRTNHCPNNTTNQKNNRKDWKVFYR